MIVEELLLRAKNEMYPLPGHSVCRSAYLILRGLSNPTLVAYCKDAEAVARAAFSPSLFLHLSVAPHGNTGKTKITEKGATAVRFIRDVATSYGEVSPETGAIHVFLMLSPASLFDRYIAWAAAFDVPTLKLRRWLGLFNGESPLAVHLKNIVWKRRVTAKVCGACVGFGVARQEILSGHYSREEKERLVEENSQAHRQHLTLIRTERRLYEERARGAPSDRDMTVLICDESHPIRHPRKVFDTLESRKIFQSVSAFIGLIDHSANRRVVFVSPTSGVVRAGDSEPTWDIGDVFVSVVFSYLQRLRQSGELKQHLFFQVDGGSTARSFSLFLLFGLLIELKWIRSATIASLIPGHTHVDVDATFSWFWRRFSKQDQGVMGWGAIRRLLAETYCNDGKGMMAEVQEITSVFRWRHFFGLDEAAFNVRSHGLKGLFGKGKEGAGALRKPHRFEMADHEGCVQVRSYFSASPDSGLYRDWRPLFKRSPVVARLSVYDLRTPWQTTRQKIVDSMRKLGKNLSHAGMSSHTLVEYENLEPPFDDPAPPFANELVVRVIRLVRAGASPQYNSDDSDNDEEEEEVDSSDGEEETFVIAQIIRRKWVIEMGEYQYLVRWEDPQYEDEWILYSQLDGGSVLEEFEQREDRREAEERAAQQKERDRERFVQLGPEDKQCPGCGKMFKNLARHKCKAK